MESRILFLQYRWKLRRNESCMIALESQLRAVNTHRDLVGRQVSDAKIWDG